MRGILTYLMFSAVAVGESLVPASFAPSPMAELSQDTLYSTRSTENGDSPHENVNPWDPYHNLRTASNSNAVNAEHRQEFRSALQLLEVALLANNPFALDLGFFPGGGLVRIVVSGMVSLGPSAINTHPDGSLVTPVPSLACSSCWSPGYQYFTPGAADYPQNAGGDGINHFAGGGGNYDVYNQHPWAPQGPKITDTADPSVIRFGAVAGTFSANPAPNSSDWFGIGYGSTLTAPSGGAHLYLVVVDTYYINNSGSYAVSAELVPEPVSFGLAFSVLALLILAGRRRLGPALRGLFR
jgi:hypothetical protein